MIYSFEGVVPIVDPSAYVHPQAVVIGKVTLGAEVYIGPGAVLRGDFGQITIDKGANVQENCVIHMFPDVHVRIEESAHIGHGAIIHGAHLQKNCLIGMNSVIMDDVVIGEESIIGALSFVKAKTHIPRRSLAVGNPAKVIREVSDEMIAWKTRGTQIYQELPQRYKASLKETQPLRPGQAQKDLKKIDFKTWTKKR